MFRPAEGVSRRRLRGGAELGAEGGPLKGFLEEASEAVLGQHHVEAQARQQPCGGGKGV